MQAIFSTNRHYIITTKLLISLKFFNMALHLVQMAMKSLLKAFLLNVQISKR